jgi:REP element-mobilizing transposase RayT
VYGVLFYVNLTVIQAKAKDIAEHGGGDQQLLFLLSVFSIDICAYAVMSNHMHLVLHVDVKQVMTWTDNEIVRRWHRLYKGLYLLKCLLEGIIKPRTVLLQVSKS